MFRKMKVSANLFLVAGLIALSTTMASAQQEPADKPPMPEETPSVEDTSDDGEVITEEMQAAVRDLNVNFVHNPDHMQGLSTSLRAGIESLPSDVDGAIVLLADMPGIDATTIDRLIAAFRPEEGVLVVVPTFKGKRGNPVVWSSRFFPALAAVQGDTGGRHLIVVHAERRQGAQFQPGRALIEKGRDSLACRQLPLAVLSLDLVRTAALPQSFLERAGLRRQLPKPSAHASCRSCCANQSVM